MDLEKFKDLTSREQLILFRQAFSLLKHHQLRILKYDIAEKLPSTFDIVGSLPTEIVFCIIKHLLPNEICLLRQVSQRWYSIFTSVEICQFALNFWFPTMPRKPHSQSYNFRSEFERRTKAYSNFRTGRPAFTTTFQRSFPTLSNAGEALRLNGAVSSDDNPQLDGHFLLITPIGFSRRVCFVLNLRENDWMEISCPHYEQFHERKLANGYLVVTTMIGRCYVWSLSLRSRIGSFPLPNANVIAIAVNQSYVAVVINLEILLWNIENKLVSGSISLPFRGDSIVSLQPHGNLLFVASSLKLCPDSGALSLRFFTADDRKSIFEQTFVVPEEFTVTSNNLNIEWDWSSGGKTPTVQLLLRSTFEFSLLIWPLLNKITMLRRESCPKHRNHPVTAMNSTCGYSNVSPSEMRPSKWLCFCKGLASSEYEIVDEVQVQPHRRTDDIQLLGNTEWLVVVACDSCAVQGWCFDEKLRSRTIETYQSL